MTKENRGYYKEAVVFNFDKAFVYFSDSWRYYNDKEYDACRPGWNRPCSVSRPLNLGAEEKGSKTTHRYYSTFSSNCCRNGREMNFGDEDETGSGTCKRLM